MVEIFERKRQAGTDDSLEAAHRWILRLESPDATATDRLEFEQWLAADPRHPDLFDQALTFRAALVRLSDEDLEEDNRNPSGAERCTAILDACGAHLRAVKYPVAIGAAALVAMVVAALPFLTSTQTDILEAAPAVAHYSTTIGETQTIVLSDGTRITLGAASSITSTFTDDARRINLTAGAGYFDVAHDAGRPFSVTAGDLTATALGTAFDVRRGAAGHRVAVANGRVDVSFPYTIGGAPTSLESRTTLSAGEQISAHLGKGLQPVTRVEASAVGAWRQDRLVYTGESLADLLYDANRYSAVPIKVADGSDGVAQFRMRGVFLGTDVGRLLSSIASIHPVEIDRSRADQILIKEKTPPLSD